MACGSAGLALVPAAAHGQTVLKAFGRIPCLPTEGVLFCEGSTPVRTLPAGCVATPDNVVPCDNQVYDPTVPDTRVPSWDGTPLDANVTLPAGGGTDLPLVIVIGGFPSTKADLDSLSEYAGISPRQWAERGFAVLSYSNRGEGGSCGWPASRVGDKACLTGWEHLDSMAYEARDTQYLAGLLVDQGIVDPARIGVTGSSWGAGQSLELATLRNRTMLPSGRLVPWVSPRRHLPMAVAAAAPMAAWSDLVPAVLPNGHDLDYTLTPFGADVRPFGVVKGSILTGLYAELQVDSYLPPPGVNPPVAVTTAVVDAGWPVLSWANPIVKPTVAYFHTFDSPYYLPSDEAPAPTLYANGWNDDIFTVSQELDWVNRVRSAHPDAQLAMFLSDIGHPRSQNKPADQGVLTGAIVAWFTHYLLGTSTPVLRGVEALTTTCPASAASAGPYLAPSWPAMHPGEVRYHAASPQTVLFASGNPEIDAELDPITGPGACAAPSASTAVPGSATYSFPVGSTGFTTIGSPTVIATLQATHVSGAPYPYLAAHLFDVAPGGKSETLVARQTYRLAGSGRQVFQLYPQAWHFAPGHTVRLQLQGQDTPYSRPDTLPGSITISALELRLPTVDTPDCTTVLSPAPPVVPAGETLAPGVTADPPDVCATHHR